MDNDKKPRIGFFQKYLTLWVALCMGLGVLIGRYLPSVPAFFGRFEFAKVSIPVAILIWVMIYPMMMKVDFESIKDVGKNPKGLYVTWVTKLADQALHDVCHRFVFLFLSCSKPLSPRNSPPSILRGAILLGAAAVHGDGVCLESPDPRQSGLHGRPGRDERPDHPAAVCPNREIPHRNQQHRCSLGHADFIRGAVRGHPPVRWDADSIPRQQTKRRELFRKTISPEI